MLYWKASFSQSGWTHRTSFVFFQIIQNASLEQWKGDVSEAPFQDLVKGIRYRMSNTPEAPPWFVFILYFLTRSWRKALWLVKCPNTILNMLAAKIRGSGNRWLRALCALLGAVIPAVVLFATPFILNEREPGPLVLIVSASLIFVVGPVLTYKVIRNSSRK